MEQNRRLIDAEALREELKFRHEMIMQDPELDKGSKWREAVCFDRVMNILAKCPTVEAAPTQIVKTEINYYDKEEIYENCTVQVLTNTKTGEVSVGWWKNEMEG